MVHKVHDHGYKRLFSNKTLFRQLLETFVNLPWVKEIDYDTAQTIDKSFIDEEYTETESDLIYKVKLKNKELFIYCLLEFQSTVDKFLAIRILNYMTSLYMDLLKSGDKYEVLPPVFPIVLYNGEQKWTAPQSAEDLIEGNDLLGDYGIHFKYFKIAENEYTSEMLLKIQNIVSTLFLAENNYDFELLKEELLTVFEKESEKEAISLFLNWFRMICVHGRIKPSDYAQLEEIYSNKMEVKSMVSTLTKTEREKLQTESKLEGKLEVAKQMKEHGIPLAPISECTGLSIEEIEQL